MESGVWGSGVGEQECGEAQGMSSGMSPELDTESGTGRDISARCTHKKYIVYHTDFFTETLMSSRSTIGNPYLMKCCVSCRRS